MYCSIVTLSVIIITLIICIYNTKKEQKARKKLHKELEESIRRHESLLNIKKRYNSKWWE